MRKTLAMPSRRLIISCVALFVALGGTSYAAVTVTNATKLGGRPASAYLLKTAQPLQSTGLVSVSLGKTKTLLKLAGGKLVVVGDCVNLSSLGDDAELYATPHEADVYWLDNSGSVPMAPGEIVGFTGSGADLSSYVDYTGSNFATPQGDYLLQETVGVHPDGVNKGTCIFDVRAWS
jgi:hypothetical protein